MGVVDNNTSINSENSVESYSRNAFDDIYSCASLSTRTNRSNQTAKGRNLNNNKKPNNSACLIKNRNANSSSEESHIATANKTVQCDASSDDIGASSVFSEITGSSAIINAGSLF